MIIKEQVELDYDDVLLLPKRSNFPSRNDVEITRDFSFFHSPRKWFGTPIFCSNMSSIATIKMCLALANNKFCTALHKFHKPEDIIELYSDPLNIIDCDIKDFSLEQSLLDDVYQYCWYTTGIRKEDVEKTEYIFSKLKKTPNIVIDVPNGYAEDFVNYCKSVRQKYPESIIMAGNVCTGPMVQELILHGGVDIVKVGIGGGANCSTRLKTGVGRPMLSTNIECGHAAHGLKNGNKKLGLICSDGGCKEIGDINKAFGSLSDFVMLGGIFAGADECEGEWKYEYQTSFGTWQPCPNGDEKPIMRKVSLKHYGMSSNYARKLHYSGEKKNYITEEGYVTEVPYKGPVRGIVENILGGIRSGCSYISSSSIKDMSKCAEFVRVNRIK